MTDAAALAGALDSMRRFTLNTLAAVDDADLVRQHSPLMSPLVWDLAHVGNYEDQWLVRALGRPGVAPQYDDMYDAFRHPRKNRPALPLLAPEPARAYIAEVRERALEALDGADLSPDHPDPLLRHGFVYHLVLQHEWQHIETMLATLQLRDAVYGPGIVDNPRPLDTTGPREVLVPAGTFRMGCDWPSAYDNERPAHDVDLPAYWIDRYPVTVGEFAVFVAEGGYDRPELWSDEGWKWRMEEGLEAPLFWGPDGTVRRWGQWIERRADEPVMHVCWHEAQAYARFVGKRLPTEGEWEKAGAHGLEGDGRVWEWTASSFQPYPGFVSFPYREYSEVFFGDDYKVLRGGSWATGVPCRRATFRNWDFPIRRQIFSGFRCARDADG